MNIVNIMNFVRGFLPTKVKGLISSFREELKL